MMPGSLEKVLEAIVERVVRRVLRDERAAKPIQLVVVATFAKEHSIAPSTVRAMIRDGRLPAVRVGRQFRVRRDALIGQPVTGRTSTGNHETPAERAEWILSRRQQPRVKRTVR